jgi:mRNA (guanine-N7-)-methyltransferase
MKNNQKYQNKQRNESIIINLRLFHNYVKESLLNDVVNYINKDNITLLDLAVGKGGDMFKWLKNDIYNVVGIDINNESIKGTNGAIHRYRNLKNKRIKNNERVPIYDYYVYDLSNKNNIPKIDNIIKNRKFNIVSCQFAIHYMFKNKESLNTFIKIVSRYISPINGYFIGTTMNGEKIKKLEKNTKNEIFEIDHLNINNDKSYGNEYKVSLGVKKGEEHYFSERPSIEYVVDMDELKRVCKIYHLEYVGSIDFKEWYEKKNNKIKLSENEKLFSYLNFSFIFKYVNN